MWSTHQGSLWTHPDWKMLLGLSLQSWLSLGGLWFYQGSGGVLLGSRWQGNEEKNSACTRRAVTGLSSFALWARPLAPTSGSFLEARSSFTP